MTVTLRTARRINVHDGYTLIVNGKEPEGLTSTAGILLNGDTNGAPGTSDRFRMNWHDLAGVTRRLLIKYHFLKRDPRPATHSTRS